jgi:hypothetical protein
MGQEWAWARAARTPGEPGASEVRKREGDSCQRPARDEGGMGIGMGIDTDNGIGRDEEPASGACVGKGGGGVARHVACVAGQVGVACGMWHV